MSMISTNIKMLRRRYSLTQEQLGAIAGVSDKAVSTWENGVAEPRMSAVRKIADYFGIAVSDILDSTDTINDLDSGAVELLYARILTDNPTYKAAVDVMRKKPHVAELVAELNHVSNEDLVLIESLIKKLASKKRK